MPALPHLEYLIYTNVGTFSVPAPPAHNQHHPQGSSDTLVPISNHVMALFLVLPATLGFPAVTSKRSRLEFPNRDGQAAVRPLAGW